MQDSSLQPLTNICSWELINEESVGMETRINSTPPELMVPAVSLLLLGDKLYLLQKRGQVYRCRSVFKYKVFKKCLTRFKGSQSYYNSSREGSECLYKLSRPSIQQLSSHFTQNHKCKLHAGTKE